MYNSIVIEYYWNLVLWFIFIFYMYLRGNKKCWNLNNICIFCIVDYNLVYIKFNYILICICKVYIYLLCKLKLNKKMNNKYSKVKGIIVLVSFNMVCII